MGLESRPVQLDAVTGPFRSVREAVDDSHRMGDVPVEGEAVRLMHQALNLGITLYDAADTYGNGYSEELIAKAFPQQRDQIVIATKVGYNFYEHGNERRGQREIPQDFSAAFIREAVEKALQRLRTDRIDILQLHNIRMDQVEDDSTKP